MKIPVFVSCPTDLNPAQDQAREIILEELDLFGLEPRALGRSDYPTDFPLREVQILARHCAGGIILGFEQFVAERGTWKRGTPKERAQTEPVSFPTSWNHLEAGILFGLGMPLLIFRDDGISGGVFDVGVTDVFVHRMPQGDLAGEDRKPLRAVFSKWQARVRNRYYGE